MEENPFDNKESKYNEAMFQIGRLNTSWINCNMLAPKGRFHDWNYELDNIWRELYPDVKKADAQKAKDLISRFKSGAKTLYELNDELRDNINKSKGKDYYWKINQRHLFLKELQDIVGKGSVYSDPSEEGI